MHIYTRSGIIAHTLSTLSTISTEPFLIFRQEIRSHDSALRFCQVRVSHMAPISAIPVLSSGKGVMCPPASSYRQISGGDCITNLHPQSDNLDQRSSNSDIRTNLA